MSVFFLSENYSCKKHETEKNQRKKGAKQKHLYANTTQKDFENYCTLHKKICFYFYIYKIKLK